MSMKTVEEKADEFLSGIGSSSLGSPINAAYEGYIAGYNEAVRWRDPKDELPEDMEARDFYNKRIKEEPTIGSIQLMEEYAKHIIEINFCDGSPTDFEKLSIEQLKKIHDNVNKCVDWVNS